MTNLQINKLFNKIKNFYKKDFDGGFYLTTFFLFEKDYYVCLDKTKKHNLVIVYVIDKNNNKTNITIDLENKKMFFSYDELSITEQIQKHLSEYDN